MQTGSAQYKRRSGRNGWLTTLTSCLVWASIPSGSLLASPSSVPESGSRLGPTDPVRDDVTSSNRGGVVSTNTLPVSLLPGRVPELSAWWDCGMRLGLESGLSKPATQALLLKVGSVSSRKTTDFLQLALAVMFVESRMRHGRESEAGALGVMQVTPIAAVEMDRQAGRHTPGRESTPTPLLIAEYAVVRYQLTSPRRNIQVGTEYLDYCLDLAGGSRPGALVCYNAGPSMLRSFERWDRIPNETSEYVARVMQALHMCGGK